MNESTRPAYPHSLRRVSQALAAVALGTALQLVPAFVSAQTSNHTVSPSLMSFPIQLVGTVSPPQTATISYTGFGTMTINSIAASGPFQFISTCPPSIAYGGPPCSVDVKFAPQAPGFSSGTLTVTTDDPVGTPDVISLYGTAGYVLGAVSDLAPSSLDFGTQQLLTQSLPATVVVTNIGTDQFSVQSASSDNIFEFPVTPLPLGGMAPPPDQPKASPAGNGNGNQPAATGQGQIEVTLTPKNEKVASGVYPCYQGNSLSAGDACSFDVAFSPITAGLKSSVITVGTWTYPSGSPAAGVTSLVATGIGASGKTIAVSPSSMDFGDVLLGQPGTPIAFSISSTGNVIDSITISDISVGPTSGKSAIARKVLTDFTLQHNCTTLAPRANCTGKMSFKPSAIGMRKANMIVSGDFDGSPLNIPLAGNGLPTPFPGLTLSVSSIGFGQRGYGDPSNTQQITLTSSGDLPVNIVSIYTLGDFFRSSTCPAVLNPGQSCTVTVGFSPSLFGMRNGELVVVSNAPDSPQSVQLQGTGCTPRVGTSFLALRSGIPVCPQ